MGMRFQLTGASVIIYQDNKVLLQQRNDNKCWGYHGGKIEMGEIVEDAKNAGSPCAAKQACIFTCAPGGARF